MAKWHRFPGKVRWLKFRQDQLDTKFDDDGVWTVDFYPDDPVAFKETGIQLEPKENEFGVYFRMKRKSVLRWRDRDTKEFKEESLGPPSIQLRSGSALTPFTGHDVGNGTSGTIVFTLYELKRIKGLGHRWEIFEISNLVELDKTADKEIPSTSSPAVEKSLADELDDDIPF